MAYSTTDVPPDGVTWTVLHIPGRAGPAGGSREHSIGRCRQSMTDVPPDEVDSELSRTVILSQRVAWIVPRMPFPAA